MADNYMDQHFEDWRPFIRRFGFMVIGVLLGIIVTRIIPMDTVMNVIVPVLVIAAIAITFSIVALAVWELRKKSVDKI